ncbi:MAG: glycosyltransferase [Muribaculaceae bacterium]|nr:glycosyltransferase [Muribaculaceae bacterium]
MGKKVIFLSRSDLRGGAAIVTFRLMMAMREEGVDARMLVCERLSDSPYVDYCAPECRIRYSFLKERLEVFVRNGFNRSTLFKVDPASAGLPLWRHPWVKEADAVFIGWVNQGMLSIDGVRKIAGLGKPVVWIMHDMWNMTGICHHAGHCAGFLAECGDCPFLGKKKRPDDMSHTTWKRKQNLYDSSSIRFVAVSSWLAGKAAESSLLHGREVAVIPNPFPIFHYVRDGVMKRNSHPVRIIFGAARIDDPIKGLPVLKEALKILRENYPAESSDMELVTFGSVKNQKSLEGFALPHRHLGIISGEEAVRDAYGNCDVVVSSSEFETLPGTLIEGQAYGCIPVAFDHGGQRDIIDHEKTGWLASWDDNPSVRASRLADGLVWGYRNAGDPVIISRMRESVTERFGASSVVRRLLALI